MCVCVCVLQLSDKILVFSQILSLSLSLNISIDYLVHFLNVFYEKYHHYCFFDYGIRQEYNRKESLK